METNKEYLEELYSDLDANELLSALIDKTLENLELRNECEIYSFGKTFIHELIEKETSYKTKLAENLDLYKKLNKMDMYDKTFSLWNKQILVLWDLKDILCRMGEDLD